MSLDLHQLATKNGFPAPEGNDHTCPNCGGPVSCAWKTIAESESEARSVIALSNRLKGKLLGVPSGAQRNRPFTAEEATRLLEELGSYRAAARKLGVSPATVTRAILPREQWPPSFDSARERRLRERAK